MIEPNHGMPEPRQKPLHEGDGNLAAHHMVRQRLSRREHRDTRYKHAESIEKSLHRGPPSSWASCAQPWCRFRRGPLATRFAALEPLNDHRDAPRDEPDNSVLDGRSPGSRVSASGHLPGFPVVSWPSAHRLQLRGQPRIWGPMPLEAKDPLPHYHSIPLRGTVTRMIMATINPRHSNSPIMNAPPLPRLIFVFGAARSGKIIKAVALVM